MTSPLAHLKAGDEVTDMAKRIAEECTGHRECDSACVVRQRLLVAEALIRRDEGVEPTSIGFSQSVRCEMVEL